MGVALGVKPDDILFGSNLVFLHFSLPLVLTVTAPSVTYGRLLDHYCERAISLSTASPILAIMLKLTVLSLSCFAKASTRKAVGILSASSFSITKQLNHAPSTISREVNRNGGRKLYGANKADATAWERAKRPKPWKLLLNKALAKLVAMKLNRSWSPQQIAGWLMRTYSNNDLHLSHETIYKTLYVQTRGALKKELQQYLRSQRVLRRSKHATLKGKGLGKIVDAVHISERPAEATRQQPSSTH